MGPVIYIIVKLTDIIDFLFSFNRTMFSKSNIDTDFITVIMVNGKIGISQGFTGTVNTDGAGTGAAFVFFFLTILCLREVTEACWSLAEITEVDFLDSGVSLEKVVAKLFKVITIGSRKSDSGDDYSWV